MEKEAYSLKDFNLSVELDAKARSVEFQKFINQLDESGHRTYWVESLEGVGPSMEITDVYTSKIMPVISFISNDYLGMSQNEETIAAGVEALRRYGTGVCAAPIIGGYLRIQRELECGLAKFVGQEASVVFSSGYGANIGVLNALMGKRDLALIDSFVHTSVLDGLKGTNVKNIGHNDVDYLDFTLKKLGDQYITKLVIVDGVYSQDGDISPLPEIIKVCKKYGAMLMVDDAHGIGTFGPTGRGVIEHYGVFSDVDIITGTLSKAFGCVGGFVAASEKLVQYLRYYAGSTVFSAGPTPQTTASALKALELMQAKPEIRQKLWENVHYLRKRLTEEGFDYGNSVSAIFPIMVRDDYKAKRVAAILLERGLYGIGICYPAVSSKEARIRVSILATHEFSDLEKLVQVLCEIDRELHIKQPK